MTDAVPMAASVEVAGVLTDLFVVLLAAKLGDELFKRIGQPAIVGEILAGVIVGPAALGIVEPGEVLEVFAELGVVFLLFWVGLETRITELREVGRAALTVGVLGVILPFAGGYALGALRGDEPATSMDDGGRDQGAAPDRGGDRPALRVLPAVLLRVHRSDRRRALRSHRGDVDPHDAGRPAAATAPCPNGPPEEAGAAPA
ncbi:MAG TPA: cation:proton antiporter [Thermoleophilaceae bacterium]|nr:cation:proton antiporter [Thermoleophilaceae bacterium]